MKRDALKYNIRASIDSDSQILPYANVSSLLALHLQYWLVPNTLLCIEYWDKLHTVEYNNNIVSNV